MEKLVLILLLTIYFICPCFSEEASSLLLREDHIRTEMDTTILYNVITPNGDGRNDVLSFDDLSDFSSVELYVFNSWGQTVFESTAYNNDWGGTRDGKALPAGSYFYILKLDGESYSSSISIIYN
jgi:gliding motility-associated-like protein